MWWKRTILGALTALGLTALVWAQSTPIYTWLGTEILRITLGSGTGVNITLDQIRNSTGASPLGATTTANVSPTGQMPSFGYLYATGAITTLNITLPNPVNQGQFVCVANSTGSTFTTNTTVAALPSGGTQTHTMNTSFNAQTLNAGSSACWTFAFTGTSTTTGVWWRTQ